MSFYITLPSNASQKYYSENKIGNYITKLPYPLQLDPSEYEVAIVGITYVNSIKLLTGIDDDNMIEVQGEKFEEILEIPTIHYDNLPQLINEVNRSFRTLSYMNALLIHMSENNRLKLSFDHKTKVKISEKLSDIFGFDGKTFFHQEQSDRTQDVKSHFIGKFPPDMSGGRYHLFIYTDIVDQQMVGSTLVPLLRMINLSGKDGETVTHTFQAPYYMNLCRHTIESISILVCDEFGSEIPFDRGQVTVTLHFRRKKTELK